MTECSVTATLCMFRLWKNEHDQLELQRLCASDPLLTREDMPLEELWAALPSALREKVTSVKDEEGIFFRCPSSECDSTHPAMGLEIELDGEIEGEDNEYPVIFYYLFGVDEAKGPLKIMGPLTAEKVTQCLLKAGMSSVMRGKKEPIQEMFHPELQGMMQEARGIAQQIKDTDPNAN